MAKFCRMDSLFRPFNILPRGHLYALWSEKERARQKSKRARRDESCLRAKRKVPRPFFFVPFGGRTRPFRKEERMSVRQTLQKWEGTNHHLLFRAKEIVPSHNIFCRTYIVCVLRNVRRCVRQIYKGETNNPVPQGDKWNVSPFFLLFFVDKALNKN